MFDGLERFVVRVLNQWRLGWYRARVSGSPRTHRRADVDPEWGATLQKALRVSSPILDVLFAAGTPVVVISRDGIPEHPAILGQLWDDTTPADGMTVWIRADLATQPGHVEIGATKSILFRVGSNTGSITPLADGTIRIETTGAVQVEGASIRLGDGAASKVALQDDIDALKAIFDAWVPVANDGGAALKTLLDDWDPEGATKVTAE